MLAISKCNVLITLSVFLSTVAFIYREKGLYISGRELKDLVRAAGNDTA